MANYALKDLLNYTGYPPITLIIYSNWFNKYRDDLADKLPVVKNRRGHNIFDQEQNERYMSNDDIAYMLHHFFSMELQYFFKKDFNCTKDDFNFYRELSNNTWTSFMSLIEGFVMNNAEMVLKLDIFKILMVDEPWYNEFCNVDTKDDKESVIIDKGNIALTTILKKFIKKWLIHVIRSRSEIEFNADFGAYINMR